MSSIIEQLRERNMLANKKKKEIVCPKRGNTSLAALQKMRFTVGDMNKESFEKKMSFIGNSIIKETSKLYHEQTVEVVFLIDKSGSCKGTEIATCKSYDHLIAQEKRENFPTIVTNVLFAGGRKWHLEKI